MIKLFSPYVPEESYDGLKRVLSGGQLAQGAQVDKFEKIFSQEFNVKHPISLNSGTAALELAYELLDLGPGDEVITTPLTCAATNLPLLRRGVKIVWADVLKHTLCINPLDVRSKMTEKTKAIVQVHLGGVKADVGKCHVPVISDAAQALGIFNGDFTCCSFQAIKHITTGDGGILVCPNKAMYDKARLLRWFGIDRTNTIKDDWTSYRTRMMSFDIELAGTKRHMNDIDATLGLFGLRSYTKIIEHRKKLFDVYRRRIKKNWAKFIFLVDGMENVNWLTTVIVDRRDDFAKLMWTHGIEVNIVQVRNDLYKIFGGKRADLPVLNQIEDKYVSLPIGMHVSEEEVNYICDVIEKGW